jgi:cytidylate kinase
LSDLIIIFGPPAVGKMTVGQALSKQCGYSLFLNHHTIEMLLTIFAWDSSEFNVLNEMFRSEIMAKAAKSDIPGLIFTYVWDLDAERDLAEINRYVAHFDNEKGSVYFVELSASLDERLIRNKTENRLRNKASKRNLQWSEDNLLATQRHRMNSQQDFVYRDKNYIKIDNTSLTPDQVAEQIMLAFKLMPAVKE